MKMKRIISLLLTAVMVLPMLLSGFALPASGDDTTGPATIPLLTDAATPNTVSDYRTESFETEAVSGTGSKLHENTSGRVWDDWYNAKGLMFRVDPTTAGQWFTPADGMDPYFCFSVMLIMKEQVDQWADGATEPAGKYNAMFWTNDSMHYDISDGNAALKEAQLTTYFYTADNGETWVPFDANGTGMANGTGATAKNTKGLGYSNRNNVCKLKMTDISTDGIWIYVPMTEFYYYGAALTGYGNDSGVTGWHDGMTDLRTGVQLVKNHEIDGVKNGSATLDKIRLHVRGASGVTPNKTTSASANVITSDFRFVYDSITPVPNSYVTEGLVTHYDGSYNTRAGHDVESTVWEDLVSGYDMTLNSDENNYFTEDGYHLDASQHTMPLQITDLVNGDAFTLEFLIKDWYQVSKYYSTFFASENDNFSLFYRKAKSYIEFKAAGCGSSVRATAGITLDTVTEGQYCSDLLVTLTYDADGMSRIYYNGVLAGEKAAQGYMDADTMLFGNTHTNKYFKATFQSIRFYDRELNATEVKRNAAIDGYGDIKDIYVSDGLFAMYSGANHTVDAWTDLAGDYDLPITVTEKNKFTAAGLYNDTTINNFPEALTKHLNDSDSYTIEFNLGDFEAKGTKYQTIINGFNANGDETLALFRRNAGDLLELKAGESVAADGGRPTAQNGLECFANNTIAITYDSTGPVCLYVNGVLRAVGTAGASAEIATMYIGQTKTNRNYATTYRSIRFYDRALTADEVKANANADGTLSKTVVTTPGYISVAQPITNIIGDVSLTRKINSQAELDAMMAADALPAAAIYTLNENLELVDDGGVAFTTLNEALVQTNYSVLPILILSNQATVDALKMFSDQNYFKDFCALSEDPALVNALRTAVPAARGMLDMTDDYAAFDALTKDQLSIIRKTVRKNNAASVVLPAHLCTKESMQYLHDRQISVWASAADTLSEEACYDLLLSGAVGIVSDDTATLLEVATQKIAENTLTRAPLNVAHRGLMSEAPENTIEGSWAAYEKGANAVEMDIYLTTDGKLAVMHDSTTERTCDQNLTVEKCTWEQLSQLYVNKGYEDHPLYSACRIPLLDDYFEAFKDVDMQFFIEIKSKNPEIIAPMKALIEEYDLYDRCTVITGRDAILAAMKEEYPEMPVSRLAKSGDSAHIPEANADAGAVNMMEVIGPYNAAHGPYKVGYGPKALRAALIRGIHVNPWTINAEDTAETEFRDFTLWGSSSLTNNYAGVIKDYGKNMTVSGIREFTYVGQQMTLEAILNTYGRTENSAVPTIEVIGGDANAVEINGAAITVRAKGTVTLLISATFTALDTPITLYAEPITLEVGTAAAEYLGFQTSVAENDVYDLRLVATIADLTDVSSIGYVISVNGGAERTVYLQYVYQSITTDFGEGIYTPDSGYVVALEINRCPIATEFTVKVMTEYANGDTVVSEAHSVSYGN